MGPKVSRAEMVEEFSQAPEEDIVSVAQIIATTELSLAAIGFMYYYLTQLPNVKKEPQ